MKWVPIVQDYRDLIARANRAAASSDGAKARALRAQAERLYATMTAKAQRMCVSTPEGRPATGARFAYTLRDPRHGEAQTVCVCQTHAEDMPQVSDHVTAIVAEDDCACEFCELQGPAGRARARPSK